MELNRRCPRENDHPTMQGRCPVCGIDWQQMQSFINDIKEECRENKIASLREEIAALERKEEE